MSGLLKWIVLKYCRRVWRSSSFWNEATWFTGCGCSASSCGALCEKRRCWDDPMGPFLCSPSPSPLSSPKMCAYPGSSACRCLLWNALPRVKAWRTSTKQNDTLKVLLTALFLSAYRETMYSKKNLVIIWWSLIEVLKFHGKHLCNKDNNVLCQETCLCELVCVLYYCSFPRDNLKISWTLFHRCILHLKYLFNLCRLGKVSLFVCF